MYVSRTSKIWMFSQYVYTRNYKLSRKGTKIQLNFWLISQDVDWTWIFFVFISFPFLTGVLLIPRPRHSGEIWILDVYKTLDSYPVYVNCDWKICRYTPTLLCVDHAKWWIWKQLGFSNLWTETVLCILCTILPKQNLNMFSLFSDYKC